MDERAFVIKQRLVKDAGGYDDLALFALLVAMADETRPGEAWTELDLRRLANTFWPEGRPVSADLVAFLHAQFRELENDIQVEIDTSAPLYRPGPELLAVVAAMRAILELHPTLTEESSDYEDGVPVPLPNPYYCACQVEDFIIEGHEPCQTKLILVRPFASRAGFDPSWLD